jgi:hypothetical protein
VKKLPSAAATLAIATPMALAGLPGPRVLTLGISREGSPRAGHSYTYLVSVHDPTRAPGWLVHLDVSAPAGATVTATSGASACRTGPDGVSCVWPQLTGGEAVAVSVTVSLASGLRVGTALATTVRLSYDWGQLTDSATCVRTVTSPPPPRPKPKPKPKPEPTPKPKPKPEPTRTPPPLSMPFPPPQLPSSPPPQLPSSPPPQLPSSPPPRLAPSPPPRKTVAPPSPPTRVSPAPRPSQPTVGTPPAPVRPQRVAAPSRKPRPRPARSPSSRPLFLRTASQLIAPPPRLPARGLPKGLLIALIIAPCVAAAVTRFARNR